MIHVSISRLWWLSFALIVMCFAAKLWAFSWWRINEVDAVMFVVTVWWVIWACTVKRDRGEQLKRKKVDDGR